MNKLFDASIFNQAWMIDKSDLDNIIQSARTITADHLAAITLNRSQVKEDKKPYVVKNGLAVIPVRGVLTKESYFFSFFSDQTRIRTFADLLAAVATADADPAVDKKILDIDCHGSTVAGCFEAVSALKKSASVKPIYTYANSNMKSGGLLIGSVGQVIGGPKSAEIGSIGVRTVHINESKLNEKIGIEVTHLAAGKYKTLGNPDEPLSKEAKEYFQDRLDTTYTMFVDAIADNRSMAVEDVLKAADGKIFLGAEAKENGLIDVLVDDLDSFISMITKEDTQMDLKEFKTKHPALHDQIRDDAIAEGRRLEAADAEQTVTDARSRCQENVIAIVGVVAGQEMADQVKKLVDTGLNSEQLAAVQGVFSREESHPGGGPTTPAANDSVSRQQILTALQNSGNLPVDGQNVATPPGGKGPDFMAEVDAYMDEKGVGKSKAIMAMRAKHPAKYEKWLEGQQK